jgi:hypothetical protein
MGDFERKADGTILIIEYSGRFFDKYGREVNKKGYLIDVKGNIINQVNMKVFDKKYLTVDGDLPMYKKFADHNFNFFEIYAHFNQPRIGEKMPT